MTSITNNFSLQACLPANRTVQRGLLAMTSVCAFLSIIPPIRQGASLALRSAATLSAAAICAERVAKEGRLSQVLKCAKIGVVALGLAGAALSLPVLITASLASDLGLQAIEMSKSLYKKEYDKAAIHFSIALVDSLALTAAMTGSLGCLITAMAVNTFVMAAALIKNFGAKDSEAIDFFLYLMLFTTSIVGITTTFKITREDPSTSHFLIKNKEKSEMTFIDRQGNIITKVQPGEVVEISIPNKETYADMQVVPSYHKDVPPSIVITGYKIRGQFLDNQGQLVTKSFLHQHTDYETIVRQEALAHEKFHTIPIGGPSIVSDELV